MTDHDAASALTEAEAAGFAAGTRLALCGGHCPYDHTKLDLRNAWFESFSRGRYHAYERER